MLTVGKLGSASAGYYESAVVAGVHASQVSRPVCRRPSMAWRRSVSVAAGALVLLAACGGGAETVLQDAVHAERDSAGTRSDGQQDDWYRVPWGPDESLRLASPETRLVLVHGASGMDQQIVEVLEGVGSCDDSCVEAARGDIMQLASEYELVQLYTGYCGRCEPDYVAAFSVINGESTAVKPDDVLELLAPIDTELEVELVFGRIDLIRQAEDGWEVIRSSKPECWPADIDHGLWSVSSTGEIEKISSYVEQADPNGKEVCN